MIPPQAMLMHSIDMTTTLMPVMFSLALATMLCGAVLVALGYDARRANSTGAPARGGAEMSRSARSLLGLATVEHAPRAA
jgi:hypothetical protein